MASPQLQRPFQSPEEPFGYNINELFWVEHQQFLLSRGYGLRPRYEPGWIGSWKYNGKYATQCEDSLSNWPWNVIDAVRIIDNVKVSLKIVPTWSEQIPVARYLSSEVLMRDPRNRTVPILDIITLSDDDEQALLVMPFLRAFYDPPFQYLAECIEALRQMLEGMVFMHEHNVAHRDACRGNIMMDSSRLIPGGFHHVVRHSPDGVIWLGPERMTGRTRLSVAPVEYFYIDFGLSSKFEGFDGRCDVIGRRGQNKTVPELSDIVPYDPFPVDIYQLGGVIKELIRNYHGLCLFWPLAKKMSRKNPKERPTASEALQQFEDIISKLGRGTSKARVMHYSQWLPTRIWRQIRHCVQPGYPS